MPNANTMGLASSFPSANLGNATSETQFKTSGGTTITLQIPSAGQLDRRPFIVRAAGRVTTGASLTFRPRLYWGISSTIGSNTMIADGGAVTVATTSSNWMLECSLLWDSTSLVLNGMQRGFNHTTIVALAVISSQITAVDPTGSTAVGFTVTGLHGTSNTSNAAYLDYLEIQAD